MARTPKRSDAAASGDGTKHGAHARATHAGYRADMVGQQGQEHQGREAHVVVVGAGMVAHRFVESLRSRDPDGALARHGHRRGGPAPLRPGRTDLLLRRRECRGPHSRALDPRRRRARPLRARRRRRPHRSRGAPASRPTSGLSVALRPAGSRRPAPTPLASPSTDSTSPDASSIAPSTMSRVFARSSSGARRSSGAGCGEPSSAAGCSGSRRRAPCRDSTSTARSCSRRTD